MITAIVLAVMVLGPLPLSLLRILLVLGVLAFVGGAMSIRRASGDVDRIIREVHEGEERQ